MMVDDDGELNDPYILGIYYVNLKQNMLENQKKISKASTYSRKLDQRLLERPNVKELIDAQEENGKNLAELWFDLVNPHKRMKKEIPFLLSHINEYENPMIYDLSMGATAVTSIGLKLAGLENVLSNSIDPYEIPLAKKEAEERRVILNIQNYDWTDMDSHFDSFFDVLIFLGNSYTTLLYEKDRIKTISNCYKILKPNGKLIIDSRNYPEHFLKGDFKYSGDYLYCGKDKVSIEPIHISDSIVILKYSHLESFKSGIIPVYPFKEGEIEELLEYAGFKKENIEVFGDYKKEFDIKDSEFFTYVARKV
jgi:SAM-dependent methyltransferase